MSEKMTIEKAREIYFGFDWNNKRCGSCEPNYCQHPFAEGFIKGHESCQGEIGLLRDLLKQWIKDSECFCADFVANKEPCTFCVTEVTLKELEAHNER